MNANEDFRNFPPFYTLQPVEATRAQQLLLWKSLILSFVKENPRFTSFDTKTFPLFHNDQLDRQLDTDAVQAVCADLIRTGHAEWEDVAQTRLRVMWRTPQEWAPIIYEFISQSGLNGSLFTVFELHSDDSSFGSAAFFGLDNAILLKALEVLARENKAQLMYSEEGGSIDEYGVRFLD